MLAHGHLREAAAVQKFLVGQQFRVGQKLRVGQKFRVGRVSRRVLRDGRTPASEIWADPEGPQVEEVPARDAAGHHVQQALLQHAVVHVGRHLPAPVWRDVVLESDPQLHMHQLPPTTASGTAEPAEPAEHNHADLGCGDLHDRERSLGEVGDADVVAQHRLVAQLHHWPQQIEVVVVDVARLTV